MRDNGGVIKQVLQRYGVWEPVETAILRHGLCEGDRVVDVGAHVGYFTILASKLVGSAGEVVAFEPEATNFALLKANGVLNGCRNLELHEAALSDRAGEALLSISPDNCGDHRLMPVAGRGWRTVQRRVFDHDHDAEQPIDFLKLDAQGSEIAVLNGMSGAVRRSADRLAALIEISPTLATAAGNGLANLLGLFDRLGALPYCVDGALHRLTLHPIGSTDLVALWERLRADERDDAGCNLLVFFSSQARDRFGVRLRDRLGALFRELPPSA